MKGCRQNIEHRTPNSELRSGSAFDVRPLLLRLLPALLLIWARMSMAAAPAVISAEFDAANKLYEQGKFTDAVSAYEKLIQSGSVSPALYFNLGNAFFKSGQAGRALVSYRQAERIAPRDSDLRANLRFVRSQITGPTRLPGRWQRWLGTLALNEWTALASVALWVWLLLLALIQFRPGWKPPLRTWVVFSGLGAALLCVCLGGALITDSTKTATVIAPEVFVRNGPLDESQTAFTVHDGAELNVIDQKEGWLQVSAGDRRTGWLKREQVLLTPHRG